MMLNTISNNLANANTTGFKRGKVEFQDMLYQSQREAGASTGSGSNLPTSVEIGNGTQVVSTARVFTQGAVKQTGEQMDIAWMAMVLSKFKCQMAPPPIRVMVRLKISSDGTILTSNGYTVLSNFQAFPAGVENVSISADGNVSVRAGGATQTFQISLARFNNPGALRSAGANLYLETLAVVPQKRYPRAEWLCSGSAGLFGELKCKCRGRNGEHDHGAARL